MVFTSNFLKKSTKLPQHHSTQFNGIEIVIEWPKGSVRTGTDEDGKPWKREMLCDYGFVPQTVGAGDKEPLDVYVGTDESSDKVFVVEQLTKEGDFDEFKILLGFPDMASAYKTYIAHYPEDWDKTRVGDVDEVPFDVVFDEIEEHQEEGKTAGSTKKVYHVSVSTERESILANGINPKVHSSIDDASKSEAQEMYDMYGDAGFFAFRSIHEAKQYPDDAGWDSDVVADLWEVTVDSSKLVKDTTIGGEGLTAVYCVEPAPASSCTLLEQQEYPNWVPVKTASPDFGYSQYNDREKDIKKLDFLVEDEEDEVIIHAEFNDQFAAGINLNPLDTSGAAWQVEGVSIADDWRGTGLGQMLYDKAIKFLREQGAEYLYSGYSMTPEALKAWERLKNRYKVEKTEDYEAKFVLILQPGSAHSAGKTAGIAYLKALQSMLK